MKITDKLTTDYTIVYVNIPTDKGTEHYVVDIEHKNMNEDVYYIEILDFDEIEQILYSHFKIDKFYGVLNGYELDEREKLLLEFIKERLVLDEV